MTKQALYQEVEEEDAHNNAENDPNKVGERRVGNSVHFSVVIGEPEDGNIRTTDGK